MGCFYPIDAWRSKEPNESGRRPMVFNPLKGQDDPLQLPCGKCNGCRADQAMEWAVRLYHESLLHKQCSFLTLTYDDDHLPDDGKINKRHLQLFFKRMRRAGYKLRYFACGEYGEQTHRPHYHAIIFGQDFINEKSDLSADLYENLRVTRLWGHGQVVIGTPSPGAFFYVAGYCHKKIGDSDTFTVMSTVPALGYEFFVKYRDDMIRNETVICEGREFPIPKAYFRMDNKSNVCWLDDLSLVKDNRRAMMRERGPVSSRGLEARELLMKSKLSLRNEVL